METGKCNKLELVTHRSELALEHGDGGVIQVLFPVERRRAIIGKFLAWMNLVNALGKHSGLIQIRL
ncbi:hypothetical protein D3C80_2061920 [compost metagenome]